MEIKLKTGRKLKLKDLSLDDRDELLDSTEWTYDKKGKPAGLKLMNSTLTKYLRIGLDGDTSDDFLKTLAIDERTEFFTIMYDYLLLVEGKASD